MRYVIMGIDYQGDGRSRTSLLRAQVRDDLNKVIFPV
jgi:hypothetical protein